MSSRSGQAASLIFNLSVLLVAATSVAFGLDWMRAPLPPMPETEASVQAAKLAAHLPAPRAVTVVAKTAPRSVYPTRQAAPAGNAVAAVNPTTQDRQTTMPAVAAPEPAAVQTPAEQPKCDIAACSAAYHSFRASDCTWQPFDGPRRLCDKGTPPQSEAAVEPTTTPDATPVSDKCDVAACQRAYFTFNAADCTYQPSNGPRRLCDKGHPSQKTAVAEPAASTPPAAAAAPDTAQASNKCDIEACKQAYFTFNSADCTYQPSDGPRRLCTKGTPPKPQAALTPPSPAAPAPPPSAAPPTSPSAPPPAASTVPAATPAQAPSPAPNAERPKQEAALPPTVPVTPPSPAPAAPADVAAPPAASAPVSDKCDVEACKRAYFTFNPADCTYKPSSGPRRLCTKGTPANSQAAAPAGGAPTRSAPDHPLPPGLVPSGR